MRNGSLHVVLGTKDERIVTELCKVLTQAGYHEPLVVRKALKMSIGQYLEENRDVDVLILQEGLEESHFFGIPEYAKYLDLIDSLRIIPILTDETMQNKQFLAELYQHHLLTAVFGRATLREIVQLIKDGRTRVAARQYYGLSSLDTLVPDSVDYESCVKYILSEGGTLKERIAYIQKRVSGSDLKNIFKMLPEETIAEAYGIPEYSTMIKECFPDRFYEKRQESGRQRGKQHETGVEAKDDGSGMARPASLTSPVLIDYLTAVKKVVFGIAGAQEHVGVTFTAIALAQYLAEKGYKVAVVEDASQKKPALSELRKSSRAEATKFGLSYQGVDYYTEFPLNELPGLLVESAYNFVLIDFGLFREEILMEFNRCVLPVVVAGSKIWEIPHMERVFQIADTRSLASYSYLFTFAAPAAKRSIVKNMEGLEHVYFADYLENPLSGKGFPAMEKMVGSYLPVMVSARGKGGSVFSKLKGLFD